METATTTTQDPTDGPTLTAEQEAAAAAIRPKQIELHLHTDASLPRRYGPKIKALGGTFSEVRGRQYKWIVCLPLVEGAAPLVDALVRDYGDGPKTTLIFRGMTGVDPDCCDSNRVDVVRQVSHTKPSPLADALAYHARVARTRVSRGELKLPTSAAATHAAAVRQAEEWLAQAREGLAKAEARLAELRAAPVLPPRERAVQPEEVRVAMDDYRARNNAGMWARVPQCYVDWQAVLAHARMAALTVAAGLDEVSAPTFVSDGWCDGMKVLRFAARTRSGHAVTLTWHDGDQDFMVRCASGGDAALLPKDLA